mmetsp:Transcript_27302/g.41217  ORF Transcript_27302/g.41217 Transcript_27302/m.41217 type:complete len:106 (+) Transcript_27302:368-685(+)
MVQLSTYFVSLRLTPHVNIERPEMFTTIISIELLSSPPQEKACEKYHSSSSVVTTEGIKFYSSPPKREDNAVIYMKYMDHGGDIDGNQSRVIDMHKGGPAKSPKL